MEAHSSCDKLILNFMMGVTKVATHVGQNVMNSVV
jgi:hypothetical protein